MTQSNIRNGNRSPSAIAATKDEKPSQALSMVMGYCIGGEVIG